MRRVIIGYLQKNILLTRCFLRRGVVGKTRRLLSTKRRKRYGVGGVYRAPTADNTVAEFNEDHHYVVFGPKGGENRGVPCEAFAYHGFNGLEKDVVAKIAEWIIRQT